ncbi:HPP family protein [Chloroflexota bacterium]
MERLATRIKAIRIIDRASLKAPKSYIIQSLLAVVAVAIILHFVGFITRTAIVAALGASTFIVFAMPNYVTAQPRRLIGGHIIGLLCGLLCYYAFMTGPLGELFKGREFILWVAVGLSIGLSIFLMTITNTEHPPAAGTAIGIVAHEWSYDTIIFILVFAVSLAVVRRLLKRYLKDLV